MAVTRAERRVIATVVHEALAGQSAMPAMRDACQNSTRPCRDILSIRINVGHERLGTVFQFLALANVGAIKAVQFIGRHHGITRSASVARRGLDLVAASATEKYTVNVADVGRIRAGFENGNGWQFHMV
jgi:hypothetical protein